MTEYVRPMQCYNLVSNANFLVCGFSGLISRHALEMQVQSYRTPLGIS